MHNFVDPDSSRSSKAGHPLLPDGPCVEYGVLDCKLGTAAGVMTRGRICPK